MWKTKLCLGTNNQFELSVPEQIKLFKKIGFEGFFTDYTTHEDIAEYKKQLSGKVPGYVIDATGMYDFSYIMERIHQKAWAIHADYLTARGEEGQP